MNDPALEKRLGRFRLLRQALASMASTDDSDTALLARLKNSGHATTRGLARFVAAHHYGAEDGFDFFDLWRRLDLQGRDELFAYLREEM